jgi:DNA-directed RNA polymerase beta subunit
MASPPADVVFEDEDPRAWGVSSVSELSAPVNRLEDKWKLVPAFQRVRGLVKQHIHSFDHFVNEELKKILEANSEIRSDVRGCVDPFACAVRLTRVCLLWLVAA